MVESLEKQIHRKFVGTACLYRHLASRQPPFLQRNLNTALDRQEKLLAVGEGVVDGTGEKMSMIANERREVGWCYPTLEMSEDLLRGQRPVLRLDRLQIRRHGTASTHGRRAQKNDTDPDWLPDPSIDFSAPCLVTLVFIDSGKDQDRQERIHVDTLTGIIESSKADSRDRIFEVKLDEAFSIEVEKLFVTAERGWNGVNRWKRTIAARYQLNVEIKCLDHRNAVQLLGLMEKKSASKYRGSLTAKDATLRATWHGLPECPPSGKLLPLLRTDGPEHSIAMNYGVELSMGWNRKRDTPLVAACTAARARRSAIVPDRDQLPTPSASEGSETASKQYIITYVFMNKRYHTMENLKCPLCATGSSIRARHEFASFDRLHTHLLLWHDHFSPHVEDGKDEASRVVRKTIHLDFASKPTENDIQPRWEGDEDSWIAPERAFNEKAYLRGEDTWTRHPRSKPSRRPESRTERLYRGGRNQTSTAQAATQPTGAQARPALSEISDLPKKKKAPWPIPKVPGIRFYRTKSKRPFEADEYVSESDESVDESWIQAHKRDDMASLPISAGGKEFYQDWNLAAAEDDFPADILARECLVRFTRRFQNKMGNNEYYEEFITLVDRLETLGLIDREVRSFCHSIERPDTEMQDQMSGPNNVNRSVREDKTCSCGSPVKSARAAVVCHNVRCSRVHFHMACVGLKRRIDDWLCPDCSS